MRSDAMRPTFASQVDSAISKATSLGNALSIPDFPPDPDEWMNVDVESVDAMLEGSLRQSSQGTSQNGAAASGAQPGDASTQQDDQLAQEQATRLRELAQKVEEFVEGKGDLEGAIFSE